MIHPENNASKGDTGAILLTMLLIVAIMSVIAYSLTEQLFQTVGRATAQENSGQAFWYSLSGEELAASLIESTYKFAPEGNSGSLSANSPLFDPVSFPLENGFITARLYDANNCFNINSLVQPAEGHQLKANETSAVIFTQLLVSLGLTEADSEAITARLTDWLDSDTQPSLGGAEDSDYERRTPAYRPQNGLVTTVSVLRAVEGFSKELFEHIRPFVCAYSDTQLGKLNVNSLRPDQAPLLAAFLQGEISLKTAQDIISDRPSGGYSTQQDFWSHPRLKGLTLAPNAQIGLMTHYFKLDARIEQRGHTRRISSLFHVTEAGDVQLIAREFGDKE